MTLKAEKIAGTIRKGISGIIQFSLKDLKTGFIMITDVAVANDLSTAKIYVSFLGQKLRDGAGMKVLDRSKGYLRSELTKRMAICEVPELIFKPDDSLGRGNKIERVISEISR